MTIGGLFEGIGGFPLAATWAGLTPVWSNEIDPFCCKVLRKNFKHEIIEADIRTIGKHNLKSVDIITGGFPCQPFSSAGKRQGTSDNRFLWPEMLRVIREIRPRYVVAENVRGLLSIEGGLVFDQVLLDLETEGYEVLPFLLPACAVNAPHRRDRVWIVAHAIGDGHSNKLGESGRKKDKKQGTEQRQERDEEIRERNGDNIERTSSERPTSDTGSIGQQRSGELKQPLNSEAHRNWKASWSNDDGTWPTQSPIRLRDDGLSGRLAKDMIKAMGNAIVPQVAYEILKAITQTDDNRSIHIKR